MSQTANRGEWSEFYAFLKILCEPNIRSSGDSGHEYLVHGVVRGIKNASSIIYDLSTKPTQIVLRRDADEEIIGSVDVSRIRAFLPDLLKAIKELPKKGGAFEIPITEPIMQMLHCTNIAISSEKKSDLTLHIFNPHTGKSAPVGFSVKSELGGDPSLLNASRATNISYLIKFPSGMDSVISELASQGLGTKELVQKLHEIGGSFTFEKYGNETFARNLRIIDESMPNVVADMVLLFNLKKGKTHLRVIAEDLPSNMDRDLIEIRFKRLLLASALGMTPDTAWNGKTIAHGGYLIVTSDGSVICSHADNLDILSDYLYEAARMDNGSRSKHGFGSLSNVEKDVWRMSMNLSIRI